MLQLFCLPRSARRARSEEARFFRVSLGVSERPTSQAKANWRRLIRGTQRSSASLYPLTDVLMVGPEYPSEASGAPNGSCRSLDRLPCRS